ncbi:hypothetical protein J6590_037769 [Homalodisca vitripennis]|nr:hypothetical protein J6590_037769 [Homalodisca vitripennis]
MARVSTEGKNELTTNLYVDRGAPSFQNHISEEATTTTVAAAQEKAESGTIFARKRATTTTVAAAQEKVQGEWSTE